MARPPLEFSLLRPQGEMMRREAILVRNILLLWAVLSFGVPLLVWLFGLGDPQGLGRSLLTELRFFGFPFHYWLLAQGCTVGFVLLCKLYCWLWERNLRSQRPSYQRPEESPREG